MKNKRNAMAMAGSAPRVESAPMCNYVKPLSHISPETWERLAQAELERFMAGETETAAERMERLRGEFEKSVSREAAQEQLTELETEKAALRERERELKAVVNGGSASRSPNGNKSIARDGTETRFMESGTILINGKPLVWHVRERLTRGDNDGEIRTFIEHTLDETRKGRRSAYIAAYGIEAGEKRFKSWKRSLSQRHIVEAKKDLGKIKRSPHELKPRTRAGGIVAEAASDLDIEKIIANPHASASDLGMKPHIYETLHKTLKALRGAGKISM